MRHARTLIVTAAVIAAVITALALPHAGAAEAAAGMRGVTPHATLAFQEEEAATQNEDDDDDDRVEVQLAVLGIALFVVVGVGGAGYFLRKRLGLVAPPPDQSASGHH